MKAGTEVVEEEQVVDMGTTSQDVYIEDQALDLTLAPGATQVRT